MSGHFGRSYVVPSQPEVLWFRHAHPDCSEANGDYEFKHHDTVALKVRVQRNF